MDYLATVIVAALVNGFATQLAVRDEITEPFRAWLADREWPTKNNVMRHRPIAGFVTRVLSCYRCAGAWLALPSTAAVTGAWPWTGGWNGVRDFAVVAAGASFGQYVIMRRLDQGDKPSTITINNGGSHHGEETRPI